MKKVIAHIIKEGGINKLIAFKALQLAYSDNHYTIYDGIKSRLHYKWTKEKIYYDLDWSLNMVKDFAQYQY
jgi:hypothetical protein